MTGGEGTMSWGGHETWYRFVGELEPETALTPVVICHGAPARRTTRRDGTTVRKHGRAVSAFRAQRP